MNLKEEMAKLTDAAKLLDLCELPNDRVHAETVNLCTKLLTETKHRQILPLLGLLYHGDEERVVAAKIIALATIQTGINDLSAAMTCIHDRSDEMKLNHVKRVINLSIKYFNLIKEELSQKESA